MTAEERKRVAESIRQAELSTSGEIVCVLARASDDYFFPAAFIVTTGVLVASLIAAILLEDWWFTISLPAFVAAELLAVFSALLVLMLFPSIRIHFVPHPLRHRRAHNNAVTQFLARNIHVTAERTGVLIFVSVEERYAEIIADSGINQHVSQDAWDGIVEELSGHAGRHDFAAAYCSSVGRVGALLAKHFPPKEDDRNELDDRLVVI
jgi:putative membrane protein